MNAHAHRLVFNPSRHVPMPVPETARACGKGGRQGTARVIRRRRKIAATGQIAALSTASVNQTANGATAANLTLNPGTTVTPITQVAALNNNANGPAQVIRSGGVNVAIPNNRLFAVAPTPAAATSSKPTRALPTTASGSVPTIC